MPALISARADQFDYPGQRRRRCKAHGRDAGMGQVCALLATGQMMRTVLIMDICPCALALTGSANDEFVCELRGYRPDIGADGWPLDPLIRSIGGGDRLSAV